MNLRIYPKNFIGRTSIYLLYIVISIELFYLARPSLAAFLEIYLKNLNSPNISYQFAAWVLMFPIGLFWLIITIFYSIEVILVSEKKNQKQFSRDFLGIKILLAIPFTGLLLLGTSISEFQNSLQLYQNSPKELLFIIVGLTIISLTYKISIKTK